MRAYLINPLAILGAAKGYNRPLDRRDFPHGTIPDRAGLFIPGQHEMRRFATLGVVSQDGAAAVDTFSFTTDQKHPLGTPAMTLDGCVYRYCQAGAADLIAGNLQQSAAPIP